MTPTEIAPSACSRLKFFQVAVEEWVFIVPLDLQRDGARTGAITFYDGG
jgi:hypothetical protein